MSYLDYPNLSPEQKATYKTLAVLEASGQHHANLQAAENAAFEKAKRDAENERLSEKFRVEREAELKAETEAKRQAAAANFEADLRQRFFDGNSFASESDFQNLLPELKKQAMLKNSERAETSEQLMRQTGDYSRM